MVIIIKFVEQNHKKKIQIFFFFPPSDELMSWADRQTSSHGAAALRQDPLQVGRSVVSSAALITAVANGKSSYKTHWSTVGVVSDLVLRLFLQSDNRRAAVATVTVINK